MQERSASLPSRIAVRERFDKPRGDSHSIGMGSVQIRQSASNMFSTTFVASRDDSKAFASRSAFEGDDFDRALIASIAHGDQAAFRELHARYYRRITHFVRAVTYCSDLVDEVANDTLWVVWQCAARFRGESKVSTWILGITRNLSVKAIRAVRRNRNDVSDAPEEQAYEPSSQPEVTEWVDAGLARLPSEQRTVLEMFYGLDQSCEEISQALNCPLNTVKTRMFHGRRKLRELLPRLAGVTTPVKSGAKRFLPKQGITPTHRKQHGAIIGAPVESAYAEEVDAIAMCFDKSRTRGGQTGYTLS